MCYNGKEYTKLTEEDSMDYQFTKLKERIVVNEIVTVHYFEYDKEYEFYGESHDFWEFVYVDKGEMLIRADDKWFKMKRGQIVFHKPGEFHNVKSDGVVAPNTVIVAFKCKSKAMSYFKNKILNVTDEERHILSTIVREATKSFSSPLGNPFLKKLDRFCEEQLFASEQMIKISLEQFLISLYRNNSTYKVKTTPRMKENMESDIVVEIINYMKENIKNKISLDDIVSFANMSKTSLKETFKKRTGKGAITYFKEMKIEYAKTLIREDSYNFTQIAEILGYDSIHYFSRQFKKITNMTPGEYSRSVKVEMK